jgi:hypothetical protein
VALDQPSMPGSGDPNDLSASLLPASRHSASLAATDSPTQAGSPPAAAEESQPGTHESAAPDSEKLGHIETADGQVLSVLADGGTVKLVPQAPTVAYGRSRPPEANPQKPTMAEVSSPQPLKPRITEAAERSALSAEGRLSPLEMTIRHVSFSTNPEGSELLGAASNEYPGRGRAARLVVTEGQSVHPFALSTSTHDSSEKLLCKFATPQSFSVRMTPIGYIEKTSGEIEAVLSEGDEVYVVREGDYFGERYRAMRVTRESVEAVEESPHDGLPFPVRPPPATMDLLAFASRDGPSDPIGGALSPDFKSELSTGPPEAPSLRAGFASASLPPSVREDRSTRRKPLRPHNRDQEAASGHERAPPEPATFVFQTLGYVRAADGDLQAIVAEGGDVYLVRQGEVFADQYLAVSVDPAMVLAARASRNTDLPKLLFSRTESAAQPASKRVDADWHSPPSWVEVSLAFPRIGALGAPGLFDWGISPFSSLGLAGFEVQTPRVTVDRPYVVY